MSTTLPQPSTKATRQFDGFITAKVKPDRVDELRGLLAEINEQTVRLMRGDPVDGAIIPFEQLTTIHYSRFVLLAERKDTDGKPIQDAATRLVKDTGPLLVFSTNYDGPVGEDACSRKSALEHHAEELVRVAGPGLERVFDCCVGYRKGDLKRFLMKGQQKAATFYVGTTGRSRDQIRWEAELRGEVERILDANAADFKEKSPDVVRSRVLDELKRGRFAELPNFPAQPDLTGKVKRVQGILVTVLVAILAASLWGAWTLLGMPIQHIESPLIDLALSGLATFGAVAVVLGTPIALFLARFRHLENTDPQFQPVFDAKTHTHFRQVSTGENDFLQNQLTHLSYVKPQPIRWFVIRFVFWALQLLATNTYNKGKLGDIPSIHFARWVLLPHRAVLFFSNFDSSWQSYLGDFIDQASSGLTAVWSNTENYPRTKWLVKSGSRDAARFLAWTRDLQLPTQVWYVAYPGISVVNANANTEIRRGLADPNCMEAVTWLFHLRSVDRVAVDELHSEARAKEMPLDPAAIQGMVLKGFSFRPDARYLMLQVKPGADAFKVRTFLGSLPLISAAEATRSVRPPDPLLNVAFTVQGFKALGFDDDLCNAFSTPFVQGSHDPYRAQVNGDVEVNDPDKWRWGSRERIPHVMLAVFGQSQAGRDELSGRNVQSVDYWAQYYLNLAEAAGLTLLETLEGRTNDGRKEHFGFRDGISQPTVRGSGRAETDGNTIDPGEILLGQVDGYGNIAHSPRSCSGFAFGFNGSYMVFRQLKQEVEAFWNYCAHGADSNEQAETVAAKMVGRWPSGASLVRHPDKDPRDPRFYEENNFSYLMNDADNDRYGARCPYGSHLRRSNPRDWELAATPEASLELANLHRIVRRGRPYGPPLADPMTPDAMIGAAKNAQNAGTPPTERGLQFICFNANIDRQFEFVQQQWCNNPKFAGLASDADPLLGPGRKPQELGIGEQTFTTQTDVRMDLKPRMIEMQRFVTTVGSAYFFMPSIPAVKLLADKAFLAPPAEHGLETIEPDENLYITNLIDDLRDKMKLDYASKQTLRGAHPKSHGIVEATFTVETNLDPRFRTGLFATPGKVYQAVVRFSNASEKVQPDSSGDIRGVAIKLLDVPGKKLLDGEEDSKTHDLLLITFPRFLTATVQEFSELTHAIVSGKIMGYLLGHPRVALRVISSLGKCASPLEIPYWSAVPYICGDHPVKYKLQPQGSAHSKIPSKPGDNYLSEALWRRVGEGSVSFDFMVQARTDPKKMPIEDATVEWSEKESPPVKVATLTIKQQTVAEPLPALQAMGENFAFNPWRCLPEHRPLGGLSRARRNIYLALSAFRRLRNAAYDPTDRTGKLDTGKPEGTVAVAPVTRAAAG